MSSKSSRSAFDPAITLCLACSSSLPPRRAISNSPATSWSVIPGDEIFVTTCCGRPICPACLSANPRLARYNPCLYCLGGVDAVSTRSPVSSASSKPGQKNVDGAVRDEDVYTLGDDESDEEEDDSVEDATPPPPYETVSAADRLLEVSLNVPDGNQEHPLPNASPIDAVVDDPMSEPTEGAGSSSAPPRYYIKPSDTLIGIALKFGVDSRALCRLNGLPPSAIRTTPHLLHTRSFLTLPPATRNPEHPRGYGTPPEDTAHAAHRVRAHAELRFRALTKEDDPHVARAYVAIADLHDPPDDSEFKLTGEQCDRAPWKKHTLESEREPGALEERAVDQYYDDDEWERRELREGRKVSLPKFPYLQDQPLSGQFAESRRSWRQWR